MLRNIMCNSLLNSFANLSLQQTRNTYVLQRKFPPGLYKFGKRHQKMKHRHFIYETVRVTEAEKHPKVKVILTQYVEGLGDVGDLLELGTNISYKSILLPKCGVYATPENIEKYCSEENLRNKQKTFSSPFVEKTLRDLNKLSVPIIMNAYNPWTLQAYHIKISLRQNGYHVPDYAITLPEKQIMGPNFELEEKEFFVTVTINNRETTQVRCRIYHKTLASEKREMPPDFVNVPREALFPEQAETLANMPLPPYVPPAIASRFGLARRRVPKKMKGKYYVLDIQDKDYYKTLNLLK